MRPSIPQLTLMSRLLDEALPLDAAGRRSWLETLPPEHQVLAQALRRALLPGDSDAADLKALDTLPKFAFADAAGGPAASGLQPGARVGPYELIRLLGAGGMAQVWLARRADGAFKRDVALKLPKQTHLRTDLERRFARERDILASLEHPHIARFYDAGIDPNGLPYVAMEYVQGHPLTDWCDAHRLGISARLELLMQVLGGVQYAHEKHVIHRDLKPSNILVTESGQVRLLDFGVAKLLETEEADQTQLTNVYGRALTPDYASPELLQGNPVDARADVYSLGVLLYELLTGVRPYRLKSAASIGMLDQAIATVDVKKPSTQHVQEAIAARGTTSEKLNRQLRGDLDAVALKALAKAPAERYPSAAALAHDLRCYLDGKPIEALPARFTDRLRKFVRRNKAVVGVTATAVAAILGTIGFTLHRETVTQARIAANAVAVSAFRRASAPATVNPGGSTAAFSPSTRSVAVLPFIDMSEKRDQEYFSDGLSEELIELLSKIPDLRVPARTSSFYFKGRAEKLETIAAELRVANVLEGSVRKAGNKLRVTAQLIRADTSEHLWSETFDRNVRDVFKIQDEIAAAVVSALQVKLAPGQQAANLHRTSNPEAHNQYLLGRQFFERGTLDGFRRAAEAYRKAVELDPRYAGAYAGLAIVESFVADPSGDAAGQQRALAAADKVVELAPDEADAFAVRGYMRLRRTWDWSGARADFEKAMTYDSTNSALQWLYVTLLDDFGRLPEALAAAKKATELDPLSSTAWLVLSWNLSANQQFAAAHEALRRALEIQPESPILLASLASLQLAEGNATEALTTFRQVSDEEVRLWGIARTEHTLGHAKESQQALDQFIANGGQAKAYDIAEIYAWRGEKDKAFEWLDRAYQQRSSDLHGFRDNGMFASLRSDARFAALLRKMNLPE
jgi:serine/threonine protein kinase/TolB-like protein/cytochrome c-type biogenesis protein CcmH/NrfG